MKQGASRSVLALALVIGVACTPDEPSADVEPDVWTVSVDGGPPGAALLGVFSVEAAPGHTVRIRHGGSAAADGSGSTHSFVGAPAAELPPLFVGGKNGAVPNAGVWGPCSGGRAEDAVGRCPIPATDAPSAWDGSAYWSTGAMTPGALRDIPLTTDIPRGRYSMVCVLHPELEVEVRVTDEPQKLDRFPEVELDLNVTSPPAARGKVRAGMTTRVPAAAVNSFFPDVVRIGARDTVTWSTRMRDPRDVVFSKERPDLSHSGPGDALPHAPRGTWDGKGEVRSGFMSTDPSAPGGRSFSLRFDRPGRYGYACRFHPDMSGTVLVTRRKP